MTSQIQKEIDKLIELHFNQPNVLYDHLFASYHQFVSEIIPYSLIQENNYFYENVDKEFIYLHGFKCSNIRIKPSTFENDNEIKFPSDARRNHLNYFASIVADVQQFVEKVDCISGNKTIKNIGDLEKETPVANIPIMVKSKYCSTNIKQDSRKECKVDPGGYFIVNGAEKIVMTMEKMVDNKILVFTKKDPSFDGGLIYTTQINSRRNDWSDNLQILTIKNRKDGVFTISTSSQLVDIPLFILMRALGIEEDQRIISYITYDLSDTKMLNLIRPSVIFSVDENGNQIRTKEEATEYLISKLKRNKRISQTDESLAKIQKKMYLEKILRQDLLPHLGEDLTKKIVFLGLMTNRLVNVMLGNQDVDDRDALQNKRLEPPGILLGQLFRQNWKKMLNEIGKHFKKKNQSDESPINVIGQIKPSTIEQGLKTALATGIWGMNKTKKGVAQALQRLSWIQGISYLRRVVAPSMDESTAKVTSIRHVNNNQSQMLCCLTGDTEVLLSNRIDMKKIKDIVDGDSVITVNKTTLKEEPSKIYNKFNRMSESLLEIVTNSGRKIKATHDHPFLIYENNGYLMKNAGELTLCDKLIIRHMEKIIVPEFDTRVIINDSDIILNELGYINQPITQERLYIIARLIGAINTIGYLNIDCKTYYASFYVDNECDAHSIIDDITKLGFELPHIESELSGWKVSANGAFAYLLSLLGGFIGEKIDISRQIPEWIMTGNKLIKREFLSAFQGGCKTTIKYNDSNILISCSSQITTPKFLVDTIKYMNQIVELFKDLDINCKVISITNPVISNDLSRVRNKFVELVFINTVENIIKYVDNINYRYSENTRKNSAPAIEYIKIIQNKINRKSKLSESQINKNKILYDIDNASEWQCQRWSSPMKDSVSHKQPCLITHLKAKLLHDNVFKNQFNKQNILPSGDIMIGIKSITKIPNEMIYDFTTISENHSFIANSFVVSNCVETPEGSKIGLVKSLAMMASITSQNSTQIDIIKSILKTFDGIKHPYDIDPLTMNLWVKIMLNGDWIGIIKMTKAQDVFEKLKKKRRENVIDKTTSIVFDYRNKEIKCYFDGGRLIRPVLIVSNNSLNITPQVITDLNKEMGLTDKSKSWKRLLSNYPNLIEYEDIESLNFLLVAEGEHRLTESKDASTHVIEYTDTTKINRYGDYRWLKYTHCDFHAWVMMGTVVANVPFSNHNYANRNIIHFSQAKQSIGVYLTSYKDRMDISQILYHPQIPIVTTQAMKYNGCLDLPYGENAVVAVCSYNGYNQEDSIIFNETSIQRGIFRADTLKKFHSEILKNPSTSQDDVFTKPDRNRVTGMKQGNYDKLNEKGYAPEETIIENQDAIIGKISPIQPTGNNNKVYKDNSEIFKTNVQGVIDRVHTGIYNAEGYEMYNVRVRMERKLIAGDKMTTRHGQKGTIGITYQQKDMPFTESGIIPDLILNPHGYPSRMSLGHFIECVASKEAAETGHFVDGTPFNNYDISQLPEALQKLGYSPYGTEKMYCGLTGRQMDVEIFIGPVYNIRLKHMVLDKVHGRARGPKQALTRQPLEGRSRDGGLKIGEMEKDAMVAHGMSQFIKERLMETSDISKVHVCDECGMFASKVIDKDYYRCKGCHNSTRISAVVIPHACKLLFQELTSVNILPRIRTERSIYSDES
jgi:DNA-directed RNA polymerase beta subunit/intein/homing endonuclease